MDRIEKDFSELDLASVDFSSGNWTWGSGGSPLKNGEWSVSFISGDLEETRYKLPTFFSEMINRSYGFGKEDAKREIRNALGV
jgi:hypothetical protein